MLDAHTLPGLNAKVLDSIKGHLSISFTISGLRVLSANQQSSLLNCSHSNHHPRPLALICRNLPGSRTSLSFEIPDTRTILVSDVNTKDDVARVRFISKVIIVEQRGEDAMS